MSSYYKNKKKAVILFFTAWILASCDNPIQAGLGSRVDINPPKITVASPKNGSYLHDLRTFNVVATDDTKVENVFVYSAMEENFDLSKAEWIGITPPGQDNPDVWTWQKNTPNEEDGIFKIIFRAVDNTGKISETDELVYTIKNLPPRIDLNIPNFSLKDRRGLLLEEISLVKNGFSIDSGGVLIGYATDVQGVQYGSPKIKFWREGTPRPTEWSEVDLPDWTAIDPNSSSKGREFRYYITDHTERDANGILIDPRIATPLPVGDYNLQIHVADTGVDENGAQDPLNTIFPPPYKIDNIDYEHLIIHVVQSAESPRLDVTFTPDNTYQSESFVIESKASHSKGIGEIDLLVRKSGDSAVHNLLWETDRENLYDVDINGVATKSRTVESSFIIPGGYYPEKGGGTFEFDSGTFEFTIQANSRAGARFSHTRTVYIDNTLPTVQITQVDPGVRVESQRWNDPNYINLIGRDADRPYFRQDYAHNIREGYIVNGRVTVNVASFDQNGLGIVEGSAPGVEVRRLRYILAKVQFSDASNDAVVKTELESILPYDHNQPWNAGTNALNNDIMYNATDTSYWITGYLDELPAPSNPTVDPLITRPAADVITLNTPQAWPGTGELYLFITAKDKADNLASLMKDNTAIGYHFRVNQGSDKPYVKFTDIRPDIKTPGDLAGVYSNVMDLNARIRGSLEDDDGIITPTNAIPDSVNDSVQFWILRDGPGETERQIPLNAGLINQRGRSIAFEFNRLELGQAYRTTPNEVAETLPDGVYRLIVKVSDAPSMKDNFTAADNFTPGPVEHTWFAIDEKTPAITIKTPEKFTFVQSDFPMQVQAFDANGPLYLEIIPPRARASKNAAAHSTLSFSSSLPHYTGDLPASAQNWDLNYLKWTTGVADTEWFNAASSADTDPNKRLAKYGAQRYADIRGNAAAWDKIKTGGSDADGETNLKRIITQTALDVSASGGAPTFDGPKDFTPPAGIGTNSRWDFHLFGIDQDHLEARVIAKDRFLKRGEEILTVKIDEVPPVVEGAVGTQWFTGTSVITGTAWDPTRDDQDKIQHASPAVPGADGAVVGVRYWTARIPSSGTWPAPPADMTVVPADPTKWQRAILSNQDAPVTPWNITIPVDAATVEGQYALYLAAFDQSGKANVRTYANGTLNPGSGGLPVKAPTANVTWADPVNTVSLTYGIDKSPPKISGLQEPVSSPFTYPRPPAYNPADELTWTDTNWTGDTVAAAYSDLRNAPFGLSGHINDSNGLKTLVITQRKGVVGTEVEIFRKADYSNTVTTKQALWSLGTSADPLPKKDTATSYSAAEWTSHAVDGDYIYTITVTDVAGRTTAITRTVNVDTVAPTLTISSPHGSPSQHAYFSTNTLFFAGDASDVHPGPVYYWDGPAASTPAVPATRADADAAVTPSGTVGWKKATGTPSWRIETILPTGEPEGERHIYIITFDTLGQRNTNITYSSESGTDYHTAANVFEFPYALDSSPPTLSEEMIATENQTLVAASFNLAGLVGDANGVRSLTITQRLQGSPNSDPHNLDYQMYNIWDSGIDDFYANGSYYLNGVLLPGASNPGENNPLKGLSHPWDTSLSFLKVDAGGAPTGTSVSMPGLPLTRDGTAYVHDNISGEFNYVITAVDIFGRTTIQVRNVRVDVQPPEISFRVPPINKAENSWFDRTSVIRGDGTDDLTGISRVLYWIGKGTLSGTNYTPPAPPSYAALSEIENRVDYIPGVNDLYWEGVSGTNQWQVSLDIDSGLAEGYYTLYVIAIDGAGNITPQPSSTTIINATAIVAGRTYTIVSTGSTNWASFGVTDAVNGTRFTAGSNGTASSGTGTVRPYYALAYNFRVDKANPTITETKIHPEVDVVYNPSPENYSPLRKALFNLELVLHDSHGLARLDIKQTKDNNPGDPLSISFAGITAGITGTDVTRTLSQLPWTSLNTSVGGVPPDGVYDYEFTVWDATISDTNPANHKSAKITRRIIVDNTKPTVTHITEPGELYQTMNSNMIIRGSAVDPAPGTIRKVLYWAGEAADTTGTGTGTYTVPPEVPAYNPADPIYDPNNTNYASRPWKEADYSSSGWSKEIPLGSAAEGQQVVAVRTEDKHGNVSDLKLYQSTNTNNVSLRFFYKDYAAPAFLETEIATETKVSKPPQFSMSGYVQDSNSVDKVVLTQYKMNGLVITETKTFTLHLNKTPAGKNLMQYWKFDGLPYLDNTGDTQTSYTSSSDGLSNTSPITFTGKPFTGSGDFKYIITAYDVSPRTSVQNRSVIIDTNPPAVTFSPGSGGNPAAGTWLNQTTILAGTASDPVTPSSGVNAVYYAVTADSDSHPALYTPPGVFNSAKWETATARGGFQSWNITLPITAASGNIAEGKYKLHIIAMDGAGNIGGTGIDTPVTYLFNVDTAFPAITAKYNNSEVDAFYSPASPSGRFTLTGEFGDSYGIDSIQITQTYDGVTKLIKEYTDGAAYNSSYNQGSAVWPTLSTWSLGSLPRDPTASNIKAPTAADITDGVYTYRITVKDTAGKETTAVRIMSVDSSDPTVTVISPQVVVDQGWTGDANITITGTATDDPDGTGPIPSGAIANVYYWLADASTAVDTLATDANGGITGASIWAEAQLISGTDNWSTGSYAFPFPEGKLKLIAQARDSANHFSAQVIKEFWVDQTDPSLTAFARIVSIAANITGPTTEAFKLSGNAWDTNGVRDITIVQRKAGVANPLEVEVVPVTGVAYTGNTGTSAGDPKGWSFDAGMANLPRLQTDAGKLTHSLDDGTYTYIVTLTDNSGRTTKTTLEINVDRTRPNATGTSDITVTYPVVPQAGVPATWVRGTAVSITGKAADSMPAVYTGTITPSGIDKIIYWAGANSATPPPVGNNITEAETNGWKTNANYNSATIEWSATLVLVDLGITDGTNKLWVRAYDKAGNLSDAYERQFGVDQTNPALTEISYNGTSPAELAYPMNTFFSLNGTVTEVNINKILITQQARDSGGNFVDSSPVQIAEITSLGGTSPNYTWTLTADTLPRGYTGNGSPAAPISTLNGIALTFIYKIAAVDLMGNISSEITRYVTIDEAGPIVAIDHPMPNADYQGTSIQIDGTATDFSAITAVKYLITPSSTAVGSLPVYTHADWKPVTDLVAGTWSAFINFSALGMTEGDLKLWVIASDGTNWGGSNVTPGQPASVAFTLDQARPEIGAITYTGTTTVSRNRYAQGGFSFEFNAIDSNVLPDNKLPTGSTGTGDYVPSGAVTITRKGTATVALTDALGLTITATPVSGYDAVKVAVNQTGGNELPEGTHTYVITVTDKSGKTTVEETTVIVDKTDPELSINSVIPVTEEGTTEKVNGLFWFTVSTSDDNGIYPYNTTENDDGSPQGGVKYYFVPAGTSGHPMTGPSPFVDTAAGTVLKPGPYQGVINTASVSSSTPYTLWVYSRDRAGRIKYLSRSFTVDQNTDKPAVNIPAMEGHNDTTNILSLNPDSTGYPLVGIVSDDDNVDGTKLRVWRSTAVGTNPDPDQDTGWTEVTGTTGLMEKTQIAGSDKQWRFTYMIGMPGYGLQDGTYKLRVTVEDKDKSYPNTNNQLPNNTADPMGIISTPANVEIRKVHTFNVDAVRPVITVTSIEPTYKQQSTAITGTVTEATLKAFRVTLDGRTINAFDSGGNMLTSGELLLSGSGPAWNWTLNIAVEAFANAADPRYLTDGPHSLLWTAEDAVGNTATLGRTFYKDSSGPDVSFTNINEAQMFIIRGRDSANSTVWYNPRVMNDAAIVTKTEDALKTIAGVITDSNPILYGSFNDEYSTVFTSPTEKKFWYRFDVDGASNIDTIANHPWIEASTVDYLPDLPDLDGTEKSVRWKIPLSSLGLAQGYHTVDIKVFDRLGTENGLKVKASANDPPGYYYPYERVAFRLDSDPPVITVPAVTDGDKALVNGATFGTHTSGQLMFTLKATVTDVTLSNVTAKIYVGNSTTARHTFPLGTIVDGAVKTLTINSQFTETDMTALLAAAATAGETSNIFRVEIVAVDGAPRQTVETLQFKMDGAPPTITTGNLVTNTGSASYPTVIIDALPTIQGNISDDSGIGEAKYTIEKWNYSSSAWQTAVSAQNLSATNFASNFVTMEAFTINLGLAPLNLTDGKYRISFDLKDKASPLPNQAAKINGPVDSINNIEFFIDRAAPAMDTVQFKSPPFYSGTEVREGGVDYMAVYLNASDLNTITHIRSRLETDTAGTYPLTAAVNSSVTGANYRLLIPKDTYAEGLHTLTLEAKDGAGRTTTITRDFTLDKTMPMLQIIEPMPVTPEPLAEITSEATIRGITVDNTSVSKLYYLFGRTEVANGSVAAAAFPANTTVDINGKIWREFNAGINKDGATIAPSSYTPATATSALDKAQGGGSLYNWTIRLPNSVDLTAGVNSLNPNGVYVSLHGNSTYLCDLPIRFMMIDSAGNAATYDYTVVVNPKGDQPTVTIASPSPANAAAQNEVGGVITVVGAAKDNDWIHRVVFRVIDGNEPDTGSPRTLPVYNALAGDGYALDAVTNTAYAAAPYNDSRGGWHQAPIVGSQGSNVQWSVNLNNTGALNAPAAGIRVVTIQVLAYDTPAANHAVAQTMGEVTRVKVTFVDGLPFVVDDTVVITPDPKNGTPFKYDDPVANKRIGGTVNIKARIRDDNGLKELAWHGEDTTQYGANILQMNPGAIAEYAKPLNAVQPGAFNAGSYYMWLEGGTRSNVPFPGSNPPAGLTWAAPALNHNGTAYNDSTLAAKAYIDYELSLTLDTTKVMNKAGPLLNKAGTWALSVLATDHTDFKMPANWTLQIDNYYPLGTYTGNGVAAGNNYQLQGLAWDTGAGVTVQGIKKVVAWFSRGPNFVPLNERDISSGAAFKAASGAITVAHDRTDANKDNPPSAASGNWNAGVINGGTSPILFPDLTYTRKYLADGITPNPVYYKTNTGNAKFISGIEIDKNEPTADNDEDGFLEGMADAGNNFQWYARIDTTKFLDGLLTVHYLVYDYAGNASYYSNTIFISNNPPKVTSIEIGTDILGVGSTEDPRGRRTVSANYGNTNITTRNKALSFKFYMQGDLGAKPFHYRFGYVSSRTPTSANALTVGQIYAITAVGTVNWEAVGAPSGYDVGTTFMATDTTSFGVGSADLLTINNIQSANIDSANINDHVFSYTYTAGDFGSGSGQIPDATDNNAWFVLRVYNSLKIPMKPDSGAIANNGMSQTGAGGINVYSYTGQFEVWDQPFDVVRVGLNVANDDTVQPEVKLWDFNPGGETAGVNGLNGLAAQPPSSIDLTPNAAKSPNLLKGGLYNPRNNNRIIERSGHIEPRYAASPGAGSFFIDGNYGSATFPKDTLSGEVIVRGFAYDEQRLGAVYLRIDSPSTHGTEFKILQSDDSSAYNPSNPGSRGLLVPVSGQSAFVYNQIGVEGHMAEWAYVWNTVNLPANFVAGDNVRIQVRVEDKRNSPNSGVTRLHPNTGETPNGTTIVNGANDGRYPLVLRNPDGWRLDKASDLGYNRIAVILAPYLNSLQRDASRGYNSLRSRQGWYSFSRGETIVAQGWNLKYPSGNTTVTFDTATATVAAAVSAQTPTGITFTAPDTAVSGNVVLVANGVSTVNDRNDNRNPWNRDDYNLSLSDNELWVDDRAAHLWATDAGNGTAVIEGNDRLQINGSETPTDPAMTMAPKTGILWASWANTASAAVYMNSNQGAAGLVNVITNIGGGQLTTTDLYYAEPQRTYAANNTHPTVFYHSNRIYANSYNQTASGGLKGYDPRGGGRFDTSSSGENHQYNVELTYHNKLNSQFEGYHRVVYRGDDIHVSYYDSKDKSMKYWYAKSGWSISSGQYNGNNVVSSNGWTAPSRHWMNLDGGSDSDDTVTVTNYNHRVRAGGNATEGSWNFNRASMAGPWSAIDLQSSGNPVIAYFDAEHSTLRLAVASVASNPQATNNNAVASATSGDFKAQYAMSSTDLNYSFAGEYVSMQIDQTNNDAHLAFFRSNSTQLIYLKLKWTGSKYEPYGPSVIVDESSANGKWVDLALDRQNRPWISYQDISRAGNFDGVKMAYYDPAKYESSGARSYDMNGVEKTGWETMNVPAIYKASDNRTSIEVWPHRDTPASVTVTKTWAAAVGYTNPDYYRIAYYLKPRN